MSDYILQTRNLTKVFGKCKAVNQISMKIEEGCIYGLLIRWFPQKGITVILSSHILGEVQQTADRIGIIAGGVLGYEGDISGEDDLEELFMEVVRENGRERR